MSKQLPFQKTKKDFIYHPTFTSKYKENDLTINCLKANVADYNNAVLQSK